MKKALLICILGLAAITSFATTAQPKPPTEQEVAIIHGSVSMFTGETLPMQGYTSDDLALRVNETNGTTSLGLITDRETIAAIGEKSIGDLANLDDGFTATISKRSPESTYKKKKATASNKPKARKKTGAEVRHQSSQLPGGVPLPPDLK